MEVNCGDWIPPGLIYGQATTLASLSQKKNICRAQSNFKSYYFLSSQDLKNVQCSIQNLIANTLKHCCAFPNSFVAKLCRNFMRWEVFEDHLALSKIPAYFWHSPVKLGYTIQCQNFYHVPQRPIS